MAKKSGDVLFTIMTYGALSLLGSMFWEALGVKWPDRTTPASRPTGPGQESTPPGSSSQGG